MLNTEFNVRREGDGGAIILICTKMKNAEKPRPAAFDLREAELFTDRDGEMMASLVLRDTSAYRAVAKAAVSRDLARIVFDDARQMCLLSKPLKKRGNIQAHKVIYPKSNSLLKPLAAKAATIEGTNPSPVIVDEYHFHPDNGVFCA